MKRDKRLLTDKASWPLLRRLLSEAVWRYRRRVAAALACMVVVSVTTAFSAWLMEPVVNEVFVARQRAMLWPIGLAVLATFVIKGAGAYGQMVLMQGVALRVVADLRSRLFAHLMRMDMAFFHRHPSGTLLTRMMGDLFALQNALTGLITSAARDGLAVFLLVGLMFYQDWLLALIAVTVIPAAVVPVVRLGKRMRRVSRRTHEHMGRFLAAMEQIVLGTRVVKAYGMEEHEARRVGVLAEEQRAVGYKQAKVRAMTRPVAEAFSGIAIAAVIVYGGHRVIDGVTTAGAFFSFITALLMAYQPLRSVAHANAQLQAGLASAQRVFDILDMEPEIRERPDARTLPPARARRIRFDDVHFRYQDGTHALRGLDLDIPAGATVALVGPSGAGKSTVLNLVPRFYDIEAGRILVDGVDVRDLTLESLRSGIALVSQEVMLFNETVRTNIAYGRPDADEAAIVAAAGDAAAHDFIMDLPQGYDTLVGEQGVKLSGGQRQRIAIARAMLKDAPILLLDEATSALDTESERQVQAALERLMAGRTTVVVAHRLSTIVNASLIYVLDHGAVVEAGSHAELLNRDGLYARLHALQFRDEIGNGGGQPARRAL